MAKVNMRPDRVALRRAKVLVNLKRRANDVNAPAGSRGANQKEFDRLSTKWGIKR